MPPRIRQDRLRTLLAAVGLVVVLLVAGQLLRGGGIFDLPDWFAGGEDDPAPRGDVTYEGQEARSASEEFLIDIGNGVARISVKAKQNHDKPGSILSGDFQSTNGTSSVSDPEDGDLPATLEVKTDYCSEGLITAIETPAPDGDEEGEGGEDDAEVVTTIRFELGDLFVCDTTLEHTVGNDAAFKQDDTPSDFHGEFVSFVAGAVETAAAAAPCPDDELEQFNQPELVNYVEEQLAIRFGVPPENVEVVPGQPGRSDAATQRDLRERLESYANRQDPDDPDKTYEALDIQYLSSDETAVEDSCYRDPGERDLDTLETVEAPDPS